MYFTFVSPFSMSFSLQTLSRTKIIYTRISDKNVNQKKTAMKRGLK